MKESIIDALIKVVTGLSGGAAALWLFWNDEENEAKTVSVKRAIGFIVLGICGAYFIAPAINEHFEFKDGIASSISFLSAVFADATLMFIWKLLKSLSKKASDIGDKLISKYFGSK